MKPFKANSGNPKELEEARRAQAIAQRQQNEDLRAVLLLSVGNRFPGRELLQRVMESCQVFEEGFDASARVNWLQGRRSIGLELRRMIRAVEPRILFDMEMNALKEEEFDGNR